MRRRGMEEAMPGIPSLRLTRCRELHSPFFSNKRFSMTGGTEPTSVLDGLTRSPATSTGSSSCATGAILRDTQLVPTDCTGLLLDPSDEGYVWNSRKEQENIHGYNWQEEIPFPISASLGNEGGMLEDIAGISNLKGANALLCGSSAVHDQSPYCPLDLPVSSALDGIPPRADLSNLHLWQGEPSNSFTLHRSSESMLQDSSPQDYHNSDLQSWIVSDLVKAVKTLEQGDYSLTQVILARLSQHLSPRMQGKPLLRTAFHFKEALSQYILSALGLTSFPSTPPFYDKILAYKDLAESSPIPTFMNLSCNQALLEALEWGQPNNIHIIDFAPFLGEQWSSFLQELAVRSRGPPKLVRITVVASVSLDMQLCIENLFQFAERLHLPLQIEMVTISDLCALPPSIGTEDAAIVVNFGNAMHSEFPTTESLINILQFIKGLSPRVVMVVDDEVEEGEGGNSSFVQYMMDSLHLYSHLLHSLELSNLSEERVTRMESLLIGPKIGAAVKRRGNEPNFPYWRSFLQAAGFNQRAMSDKAGCQAEMIVHQFSNGGLPGFTVEKHQGGLELRWQNHRLLCVSAWVPY